MATYKPNARFLNALAVSIAKDVKTDPTALTVHLEDMNGTEGAYLCFVLIDLFVKRRDRKGANFVTEIVTEMVG